MCAAFLGIPLGLIALVYFGGEGYKLIHDRLAATFFGLAVGICVYYVCRGIDVLEERKRDNPRPFDVPLDVGAVLDGLETLLKASRKGPHYWQIKEFSLEQAKLAATLNFNEMYEGLFSHPMSVQRNILLLATVEPWTEKLPQDDIHKMTDNLYRGRGQEPLSRVTLKWEVDSPLSRGECDIHIGLLQNEIYRALEHPAPEPPKVPHPLVPPNWALGVLIAASLYCMDRYSHYDEAKARADEARQQRQEAWERILDPAQHMRDAEELNRQQNWQMRQPRQFVPPQGQFTDPYASGRPASRNDNSGSQNGSSINGVPMEPIVRPDSTGQTNRNFFYFNKDGQR